MALRWCPAFTWGARRHKHVCCMREFHKGEHYCECGQTWTSSSLQQQSFGASSASEQG